jgi:methyl-accepting chemotaxis protein
VGQSLGVIVEQATKVSDLINGIARASNEQAQGVEQVNIAVSQMDRVTQQNAAGAEEAASASEELSAQAVAVNSVVEDLSALVGSVKKTETTSQVKPPPAAKKPAPKAKAAPAAKPAPVAASTASAEDAQWEQLTKSESNDLSDF